MSTSSDGAPTLLSSLHAQPTLKVLTAAEETGFAVTVLGTDRENAEEEWESRLVSEAAELGISIPLLPREETTSALPARRRPSIAHDGRSISTDSFNSKFSRPVTDHSKSWDRSSNGPISVQSANRRNSQASNSSRSRDSVLSQSLPITKAPRTSSIPPTSPRIGAQSPDSVGSPSSPHRHLVRGLSRLRLRRHASDKSVTVCPHCANSDRVNQEVLHQLPCSHNYCTSALRNLINFTHAQDPTAWPSCCNQRIPKHLIDLARGSQERIGLGLRSSTWTTTSPRPVSDHDKDSLASSEKVPTVLESGEQSPVSPITEEADSAIAEANLQKALKLSEFRDLRRRQIQQRNRLLRWDAKHKAELIAAATRMKKVTSQTLEQDIEALEEKHAGTVVSVEDMHIAAEAKLREAQNTEKRNNLTALKHMEAYCRGESGNGEPHNRAVSEQDLRELAKTQRLRDTMDVRHESAINVLRGEQNQRLKNRQIRNENELDQLQIKHDRELDRIQHDLDQDLRSWEKQVDHKKTMLERWWRIENQICLSKSSSTGDSELNSSDSLTPLKWSRDLDSDDQSTQGSDDFYNLTNAWHTPKLPPTLPSLKVDAFSEMV